MANDRVVENARARAEYLTRSSSRHRRDAIAREVLPVLINPAARDLDDFYRDRDARRSAGLAVIYADALIEALDAPADPSEGEEVTSKLEARAEMVGICAGRTVEILGPELPQAGDRVHLKDPDDLERVDHQGNVLYSRDLMVCVHWDRNEMSGNEVEFEDIHVSKLEVVPRGE